MVSSDTIGEAWLEVARTILDRGVPSRYDDKPIVEIDLVTVGVDHPRSSDPIIEQLADPERLAWMHANFTDYSLVRELGDARSYASRLFDYAGVGRDQVAWVVQRLRDDPTSRSATITTFEPLIDTTYIPCVSMLDFWLRDGRVDQVVYAHSIDFGSKGYGNLVELAWLQEHVARELGVEIGRLDFIVKSAHIYDTERQYMSGVLSSATATPTRAE